MESCLFLPPWYVLLMNDLINASSAVAKAVSVYVIGVRCTHRLVAAVAFGWWGW